MIREPRYTLLAVLTLAAGIGANAAIFGLLDAVYFRPLPIVDPDRLVDISLESPGSRFTSVSYEEFRDVERSVPALKDVIAIGSRGVTLNQNGETQLLTIQYVSGRFFPSLGIPLQLGRGLTEADDRPDVTTPQVVINHQLWKQRLGGARDVIGRTIQLNNTMFTVVGVTAPEFVGLRRIVRTDVWVATEQAPFVVPGLRRELTDRNHRWFQLVGRLADGADIDQARAQLDLLVTRWRASDARTYQEARLGVASQKEATRKATRQGAVFLALVSLVLLIACANVANLTLARGEARRRDLALRAALGASRWDLMRQTLFESAVVALAATALALLLASWLIRLLPALLPPGASMIVLDVRVDARLLAFAGVLAAVSTALVGIVPAWRGSRADIVGGLKAQPSTSTLGGAAVQLRDVLVVGEIALSAVILIAAGLLVRSFAQSLAVNPGFDTQKEVATFYLVPGLKGMDRAATFRFLEACRENVATAPGVKAVSYGIRLPAQGNEAGWSAEFTIPGKQPPPGHDTFDIRYTMVGPDYFRVMGTHILHGRGIGTEDRPDSAPVAVISESMARSLWPGENPLGRTIRMGRARPIDREIVGVAEDIRISGLYEAPEPYVYVPYAQNQQGFGLLLVEMAGDPASVIPAARRRIAEVNAGVPILTVGSFEDHMGTLLYEDRRNAQIALGIALLALVLGAVGVHGVVALVTARRTREIGIRLALGADRRQLLRVLLGRSVILALVGTAAGIAGGIAAGRLLRSWLHGIDPADPWSFAAATAVVAGVALAASFTPVWRASRMDPAVALREE